MSSKRVFFYFLLHCPSDQHIIKPSRLGRGQGNGMFWLFKEGICLLSFSVISSSFTLSAVISISIFAAFYGRYYGACRRCRRKGEILWGQPAGHRPAYEHRIVPRGWKKLKFKLDVWLLACMWLIFILNYTRSHMLLHPLIYVILPAANIFAGMTLATAGFAEGLITVFIVVCSIIILPDYSSNTRGLSSTERAVAE